MESAGGVRMFPTYISGNLEGMSVKLFPDLCIHREAQNDIYCLVFEFQAKIAKKQLSRLFKKAVWACKLYEILQNCYY